MRTYIVGWTTALLLAMGAQCAMADTVPFFEDFENAFATSNNQGNTGNSGATALFSCHQGSSCSGNDWVTSGTGNIDLLSGGITCHSGVRCVDLDGTGTTGPTPTTLLSASPITLLANHTYQLTAWISGSQVGTGTDTATLGFYDNGATPTALSTIVSTGAMAAATAFTLFTVNYTVGASNVLARLGFTNTTSGDNHGNILDDIRVADVAAVPLPASAWLLLSGALMLGVLARRQRNGLGSAA